MVELHGLNVLVMIFYHLLLFSILQKSYADKNICTDGDYRDTTLKLLRERAVADPFIDYTKFNENPKIPTSFEASDVILRSDGEMMYVVFDNTYSIGAFCVHTDMLKNNCTDQLLEWPDSTLNGLESQFEGIAYNSFDDTYFVAQEAIPVLNEKKKYQPNIFEIRLGKNTFNPKIEIVESCRVNMVFESDSKGFEGLEFAHSQTTGKTYLFGLCEANKCASSIPDKKSNVEIGNGRIMILEKQEATSTTPCSWEIVDTMKLPSTIEFIDYSAMSIYRGGGLLSFPTYVAITSQENSQVWIGFIEELDSYPYFKIKSLDNDLSYYLPRSTEVTDECSIKYCNIEGVAWRGKNQLVLVSDKSKKDQNVICNDKDQSIHYVKLPEYLTN